VGRILAPLVGVGFTAVVGIQDGQHGAQPTRDHGALPPHAPQPGRDGLIERSAQQAIGDEVEHHGGADEAPQEPLPLAPETTGLNTQSPAASGASFKSRGSNADRGSGWAAAALGASMMAWRTC